MLCGTINEAIIMVVDPITVHLVQRLTWTQQGQGTTLIRAGTIIDLQWKLVGATSTDLKDLVHKKAATAVSKRRIETIIKL